MGFVKSTLKSAVLLKALDVARREAAKPQNQAKARQLLAKVTERTSSARSSRGRTPSTRTVWGRPAPTAGTGRWAGARQRAK